MGVLVENSTFMNNLDDHINTKTEDGVLLKRIDAYTYEVDSDLNYRVGDELIFYDAVNHKLLNTVYLQEFEQLNADKTRIKVDRPVEGTVENGNSDNIRATIIYNADSSGKGSVIRNNKFINSRRHAYIVRSANSVFEDNTVTNCGGAAVCAANEIGSKASEGPFPSAFTMRNNNISADGSVTYGYYPIQVKSWGADKNSSRAIDGFLIEGNTVTSASMLEDNVKSVYIDCVKDLYMLSNTIKYDGEISSSAMPIYVKNSEIAEINGLDFDYDKKVNAVITFDGCTVNKSYVRNIRKNTANAASKDFVIK